MDAAGQPLFIGQLVFHGILYHVAAVRFGSVVPNNSRVFGAYYQHNLGYVVFGAEANGDQNEEVNHGIALRLEINGVEHQLEAFRVGARVVNNTRVRGVLVHDNVNYFVFSQTVEGEDAAVPGDPVIFAAVDPQEGIDEGGEVFD